MLGRILAESMTRRSVSEYSNRQLNWHKRSAGLESDHRSQANPGLLLVRDVFGIRRHLAAGTAAEE